MPSLLGLPTEQVNVVFGRPSYYELGSDKPLNSVGEIAKVVSRIAFYNTKFDVIPVGESQVMIQMRSMVVDSDYWFETYGMTDSMGPATSGVSFMLGHVTERTLLAHIFKALEQRALHEVAEFFVLDDMRPLYPHEGNKRTSRRSPLVRGASDGASSPSLAGHDNGRDDNPLSQEEMA